MLGDVLRRDPGGGQTPPGYGLLDRRLVVALLTAGGLVAVTIAGMLAAADTGAARAVLGLFAIPIVGVVVVGFALSLGWVIGVRGLETADLFQGVAGAVVCLVVYVLLGAAALTQYGQAVRGPAILGAFAATGALALAIGAYVYTTDRDLSHWARYARWLFLGGLVPALVGSGLLFVAPAAATPVLGVAFALFLAGYVCDLVYEIWCTASGERRPLANGLALYVAFAGVFVHVLQLALDAAEHDVAERLLGIAREIVGV